MKTAVVLTVLAGVVMSGCGGTGRTASSRAQVLSVAQTRTVFADAGLRLQAIPGALAIAAKLGKLPSPRAIFGATDAGRPLAYVVVFASAKDAIRVSRPSLQ